MEYIKTQMQVRSECTGPSRAIRDIIHHGGPRGLGKGLGITILREVPAAGLYFSSFEMLVRLKKDNTAWVFASGGIAGMVSWMFTYPQDVIKSRLQADYLDYRKRYNSYTQCVVHSIQTEGCGIFLRGMTSTLIRAFPVNAVTMGVVTLIMRATSEHDVSAYDAMSRLRLNESVIVQLPEPVEEYFKQRAIRYHRVKYHHNVVTQATDGPSIVQIQKPIFAVAPYRLYVENMLYAMPTKRKPKDPKALEVGTMRTNVSLATFLRVLEKKLVPKLIKLEEIDDFSIFWFQEKALNDQYLQNFIFDDNTSYVIITNSERSKNTSIVEDDGSNILAPSILAREHANILRKESITTSDFLLPTNLLSSSTGKIYGFYYVT